MTIFSLYLRAQISIVYQKFYFCSNFIFFVRYITNKTVPGIEPFVGKMHNGFVRELRLSSEMRQKLDGRPTLLTVATL